MSESNTGNFQKEIDIHLAKYEKKIGKKALKSVTAVYNEQLKRSSTRIRLQDKIADREKAKFKEISKDW